jgi:hypothetical protein
MEKVPAVPKSTAPGDSAADAGDGETKPKTPATRTAIMKPTFILLTRKLQEVRRFGNRILPANVCYR